MSQIILTKTPDCEDTVSEVISITSPTQFLLNTMNSVNAVIKFNGATVATLSRGIPFYHAIVKGDYTACITGPCTMATICIDDIIDEGAASNQIDSDILIDCAGATVEVPVNAVVSIAGTERTLNVRVVEDCNPQDFEIVCASTDGRLLLLQTAANPPELTEIDGTAIVDGATALNCDVEYIPSESCWQDDTDDTIKYTRIIYFNVNDITDITTVWLDASGAVIAPPSNIEMCPVVVSSGGGAFDDQTHVLTYGLNINVPIGAKSVVITRITGTVVVDGGFTLDDAPFAQAIAYDATVADGARGLLPAITVAGGTWQWAAVLPILEES